MFSRWPFVLSQNEVWSILRGLYMWQKRPCRVVRCFSFSGTTSASFDHAIMNDQLSTERSSEITTKLTILFRVHECVRMCVVPVDPWIASKSNILHFFFFSGHTFCGTFVHVYTLKDAGPPAEASCQVIKLFLLFVPCSSIQRAINLFPPVHFPRSPSTVYMHI